MAASKRLVVITGLSGAGRSEAVRVFEDLGYFCVDNLPPALIAKFAELLQISPGVKAGALVLDIRGGMLSSDWQQALEELKNSQQAFQVVYLEADEETL
ncbi:MAG: RNase adaptor protein RapZ, partial [Firmicutes bacterium]|nr:RNase adaptor protein RapZ [Bacillota bacterium]